MLKRNGVLILAAVLICCVFLSLLPMSAAAQTEQEIIQGEESFEVVVVSKRDIIGADPDKKKLDANGIPAIKSTPEEKWIDRLDDPPAYVREFYDWLVENGDGDGREDALIQPTTGEYLFNQYYGHRIVTLEDQTFSFTYDSSTTNLQTAGDAAMDQKEKALKAEMRGYYLATLASFDRDHAEVFWLGNQSSYIAWAHDITYRSTGSGTGEATYSVSLYAMLQYSGFDIRATEYRNETTIYATIKERDNMINTLAAQATGSRYEQLCFLNKWLTENNQYNTSADLNAISGDCRNCIGALDGRIGTQGPVCEGYARAFKVLCDKLGIPCVLVDGANHMWNYVQMEDGKWYGVDVTWNDPTGGNSGAVSGGENERYLLVGSNTKIGSKTFIESHPVCNDVYDNTTKFTNGPVLSADKYEPNQTPVVTGISVMMPPNKTVYEIGEEMNTDGMTLIVYYSDGTMQFAADGFTVSGFDSATPGEKTITVSYQGFTVSFTVTVKEKEKLTIITQPESVVAKPGDTVTFTVVASGEGLSYQWKYKNPTATGFINSNIAGSKTSSLTVSNLNNGHNGRQYLCVVKDASGNTVETVAVTLQVAYIVTDAKSQSAEVNEKAIFSVQFSMTEGVTYQWQYKGNTASSTWANTSMTGAKTAALTVPAIETRNGYTYRCKITVSGLAEPIYSKEATLTLLRKPTVITSQPKSVTAQVGDTVTFTVVAEGAVSYRWQYRNAGAENWSNTSLSGYNTATLTVANVATGHHGRQYRCIVTDANGNVVESEPATLTVPYLVKDSATAFGVPVNTDHVFSVQYSITEGVTYQWQYKGNTSSSTWGNTGLPGNKTNALTVKAMSTRNGYRYRCIIKVNGQEIVSKAAILYVASQTAVITKQPVDASAVCGDYATFSIEAQGEGLIYQWQWSDNGGESWSDTRGTGHHTNTLRVKTNNYNGNRLYRCRVRTVNGSGWNEVYSEAAMMTVLPAAEVVAVPQNVTVKAGEAATFHVEADGEGLTYQWQWAKFVGSWMNTSASGATTDTLTIANVNKEMNGRYYRVIITNAYGGFVETKYVRLYVK